MVGFGYDEGPFYQMQRMEQYKKHLKKMLDTGHAYYCYSSKEELDVLREQQMQQGLKPGYERKMAPRGRKGVARSASRHTTCDSF